jgi:hypothetical protein
MKRYGSRPEGSRPLLPLSTFVSFTGTKTNAPLSYWFLGGNLVQYRVKAEKGQEAARQFYSNSFFELSRPA